MSAKSIARTSAREERGSATLQPPPSPPPDGIASPPLAAAPAPVSPAAPPSPAAALPLAPAVPALPPLPPAPPAPPLGSPVPAAGGTSMPPCTTPSVTATKPIDRQPRVPTSASSQPV